MWVSMRPVAASNDHEATFRLYDVEQGLGSRVSGMHAEDAGESARGNKHGSGDALSLGIIGRNEDRIKRFFRVD
jgi:hypothetical protein